MAKVYVFLADGFEDVEALTPVDILRRGGVEVLTVSVMGELLVESAHAVKVQADALFGDIASFKDADALLLPGGMPGASNLKAHESLCDVLANHHAQGKYLGAICAAPMVLGSIGLLKNKRATCYPGFEKYLDGARYTAELVTVDNNIVTAKGPAASVKYAFTLLEMLTSAAKSREVEEGMLFI